MSLLPVFRRLVSQLERQHFRDPFASWHLNGPITPSFGSIFHPDEVKKLLEIPKSERLDTMVENLLKDFERDWSKLGPTTTKDGFQVNVDVQHFDPKEITVKVQGNEVLIEGKHEEKKDEHGLISRQFTRRYSLPAGVDLDKLQSTLSTDGILSIKAPLPEKLEDKAERVIEIQHEEKKQ